MIFGTKITGAKTVPIIFDANTVSAKRIAFLALVAAISWSALASPAWADGIPHAWGLNLQDPGSPLQARINDFHDMLCSGSSPCDHQRLRPVPARSMSWCATISGPTRFRRPQHIM